MKRFKKITQRTLSFLLTISILLTTVFAGVVAAAQEKDTRQILTAGETDTDFTPVMRFVVTSDVHIRAASANYLSYERLEQLYTTAYAYSEAQTDYNKIDGFFFVGDNTQTGSKEQQTYFFNYLAENTKEGGVAWAVMGNHEFKATGQNYADPAGATAKFVEYSGYESEDNHFTMGGYHFILLSTDLYDTTNKIYFSEEKLAWLKQELDIAVADTPDKPIFVMQHEPAYDTMKGTKGGDKGLKAVLENYPQVIDFSGHTHYTLSDPRTIWQGSFTALNTGSLCYASVPIIGTSYNEGGPKATDYEGGWTTGSVDDSVRNAGMYYIVEVDADSRVRILIYNIFTESLWGEPYILDSVDPADFKYTDDRANDAVKPEFAATDSLQLLSAYYKNVTMTIPHASCKDVVQSYRAEVYQGGKLIQTIYRTSGANYGEAAPAVKLYIKDLEPSTAYTVKVYACSSWGLESDPLTARVITSAANTTAKADVLDVAFLEDGTAVNKINGEVLNVNGTPTVTYNEDQDRYTASFDGSNDAYGYDGIHNWYDVMTNSLTLEAYVYLEETPTASEGYVNVVSNQQTGGFGFTYKSDGKMYFYCMAGSESYTCPNAQVQTGQWVHLVGTYDGTAVRLYIDGELVSELAASGDLVYPAHSARFMALGADSAVLKYARFFNGDIATTKVYTEALTAEQVAERYSNVNVNEPTTDREVLIGDADGSAVVDAADAELILNYLVGWDTEMDVEAADVNGNGAVDTHDAVLIMLSVEDGDTTQGDTAAQVTLTDKTTGAASLAATAGDTLELLVSLSGNPGISSLHTMLRLPEGWTVTECTELGLFADSESVVTKLSPMGADPYSCIWLMPTADDTLKENGDLFLVKVKISEAAATGTYAIKLDTSGGTLEEDNWVLNTDGGKTNVAVSAESMTIQVTGIPVASGACPVHPTSNAWMPVGQSYLGAGGVLAGGHYILAEDIDIAAAFTIAAGEEVCVDLNGHDITAPNTDGIRAFYNEGTLTIVDSAETDGVISGGRIKGVNNNDSYNGATNALGGNIYNAGTFNLYGGTVSGGYVSSSTVYAKSQGGNIYGEAGSVINICGGTVTGGTVSRTSYTSDNTIAGGGNIYSLGTVTISGGTVAAGEATCTYSNTSASRYNYVYGGNIFMDAGSVLTVTGGTVSDGVINSTRTNTSGLAPISVGGGNIYAKGATVSISGGTISRGDVKATANGCGTASAAFADAKVYGGSIYVNGGTFTISGGTVSDGKVTLVATNTGVTTKDSDAVLYINGGNIFLTGTTATISGGTISNGNACLSGTYGETKGGNLYISSTAAVTMTDGTITGGESDSSGGNIFNSGTLNMSGGTITLGMAENKKNTAGNLYISGTGTVNMSGDATISDGHAYYRGGNIYMSNKAKLTISGNASVTGGNVSTASSANWGGNIYVTGASASIKLYDDAVISGGVAYTDRGGNVAVNSGAKFYMYGGKIIDGQFRLGEVGGETLYLYGGTVSEFITAGSESIYLYNGTISGCDMKYLAACACAVDNGDGSYTVWHTGANDGTCAVCAFNYTENNITMESGKHTYVDSVCTVCGTEMTEHSSHDYSEDPLVCGECGYVRATLKLTTVTLRPGVAGLYFSGELTWDETDEDILACGITVSLKNSLPVADGSDESCLYTEGSVSALVTNILSSENTVDENKQSARTPVYARAYVQLADGRYIYSDPVRASLQQVVLAAESKWDSLSDAQKDALGAMYESFSGVMDSWQIPNIKTYL